MLMKKLFFGYICHIVHVFICWVLGEKGPLLSNHMFSTKCKNVRYWNFVQKAEADVNQYLKIQFKLIEVQYNLVEYSKWTKIILVTFLTFQVFSTSLVSKKKIALKDMLLMKQKWIFPRS